MGALITKEADSMSAMKFRMSKADKALWMDMKFYKEKGVAEREEAQKIPRSGSSVHSSLIRKLELE